MPLPNFLVIGAQKSGTSWLHRFLSSRPDVFVPRTRKALWFFDHEDQFHGLGPPGYAAYFADAGDAVAIGEVTPGYLYVDSPVSEAAPVSDFQRQTPERVAAMLGRDVKLIASLRNPVDRALSAFLHHRRKGRIPAGETIGKWLGRHGILGIGFYGAQLARWAEVFPRSSFFLVSYEALFADAGRRSALLTFIGAAAWHGNELLDTRINAGDGFTRTPAGAFDSAGALLATPDEIDGLRRAYREDVRRLSGHWDIELSPWSSDF